MKKVILLIILCFFMEMQLASQTYKPEWESLDKRPVPGWFTDAKFGIFIHWGIYSVPGWAPTQLHEGEKHDRSFSEWYWRHLTNGVDHFVNHHSEFYGDKLQYRDFVTDFKAEYFDAGMWAEIFKQSGAKYVVLTSKHHDGYALWPSVYSPNWNSVDIGPHRNICKELSDAVKANGLKMGFYYSLYEWYHSLYLTDIPRFVDSHMLPQLKELINTFEPSLLFSDGEWTQTSDVWRSEEFLAWLYNESTVKNSIVVNDRWGSETRKLHGDYHAAEYSDEVDVYYDKLWEECRGIGVSFGWNKQENLSDYHTSEELVHKLIKIVSHGGNFLLNVGPTADGRIPVIMQQRLADIGAWLAVNGEAIYDTRMWDREKQVKNRKNNPDIYFTQKGKDLYLICTKWSQQPITIEGIRNIKKISLLGTNENVEFESRQDKVTIYPPAIHPGNAPCQYAWVYKLSN